MHLITRNRVRYVIEVSYLLLGCMYSVCCFVCDSDNSSLSATNDNCSPRWIVHYQSRGRGYGTDKHITSATSPQLCLKTCVDNKSCILAHWSRKNQHSQGCYLFSRRSRYRWYLSHVTQFEIVRQCDNTSGTQSHKLLMYHYVILCSILHS